MRGWSSRIIHQTRIGMLGPTCLVSFSILERNAWHANRETEAQGGGRGFMGTLAPNGKAWSEYCVGQPELGTGMVLGPWGECLAWAVAYEHRSPEWHKDPQYRCLSSHSARAAVIVPRVSLQTNIS